MSSRSHDAAWVDLRQIAEAARDACLAVERDGGRRFDLLKRMDDAMERLQDELPAERVLALLDAAEARPLVQPREGSPAASMDKHEAVATLRKVIEFYRADAKLHSDTASMLQLRQATLADQALDVLEAMAVQADNAANVHPPEPDSGWERAAAYEPGQTCPECGALVGHWKPCSNASPELQERWSNLHESVEGAGEAVDGAEAQPTRPDEPVPGDLFDSEAD